MAEVKSFGSMEPTAKRGQWQVFPFLRSLENRALVWEISALMLENIGLGCRIREALLETRAAGDQTSSPQRKLWVSQPK